MEKKDIASLLDALSERPLVGEGDALSPELEAVCRRAAEVMLRKEKIFPDPAADAGSLAALLAALHAGKDTDAERNAFAQAAADSAELRLESESALAFLEGLGEPLEPAPEHLLGALDAMHGEPAVKPGVWSLSSIFMMRRTSWRLASAFALLAVVGGLSWSIYGPSRRSVDAAQGGPPATANAVATKAASTANGADPAALADSCAPSATIQAAGTKKAAVARQAAPGTAQPGIGCGSDANRQLADKADALAREREAMQRAEAIRQAEIARREAEGASREGAAAAALPADRFGTLGAIGAARPTFNFDNGNAAIPASPPAYSYGSTFRGTPPATAMPPSGIGR